MGEASYPAFADKRDRIIPGRNFYHSSAIIRIPSAARKILRLLRAEGSHELNAVRITYAKDAAACRLNRA